MILSQVHYLPHISSSKANQLRGQSSSTNQSTILHQLSKTQSPFKTYTRNQLISWVITRLLRKTNSGFAFPTGVSNNLASFLVPRYQSDWNNEITNQTVGSSAIPIIFLATWTLKISSSQNRTIKCLSSSRSKLGFHQTKQNFYFEETPNPDFGITRFVRFDT